MPASERTRDTLTYLAILVPSFMVLQFALILMHEFTHSTVAWLLGYMPSPQGIVWGNPLLMCGWDEGVHYKAIVAQGHLRAEALIGVSPLIVHTLVVVVGFRAMVSEWLAARKWLFHTVFWFVAANLMELVAYIFMRGFAPNGDTGHFNHGLGLSPWWLFILGSLALAAAMAFLYSRILPRMYRIFASHNTALRWTIFLASLFIIFFWGSGLRVMFYVYPDPQWLFGALAFPAAGLLVWLYRPTGQAISQRRQ